MPQHPFTPRFESLPPTLPVFPLPGAVVLPGASLQLNIFEPRYLNMVFDALGAGRMFGMIQPDPAAGDPGDRVPALYGTGCAGRVTAFSETEDGRLLIVLVGVCRFDILDELASIRGYRRMVVDWSRFEDDVSTPRVEGVDTVRLLAALRGYCESANLEVDWDAAAKLGPARLVDFMSMNLPLDPEDKQTLVEAADHEARARRLGFIANMGADGAVDEGATRH